MAKKREKQSEEFKRDAVRMMRNRGSFTRAPLRRDDHALSLDKNKTDDPRAWALDAGVARYVPS